MKGILRRVIGTSGANGAQTVSTPSGSPKRLLQVLIAYSAAPTYTGTNLIIKINSGAGAAYDVTLDVGTNDGQFKTYIPNGKVVLKEDDTLDVTAPSGGGAITSSVSIYTEEISF